MSDNAQQPAFKPLWHLISREKIAIGTLATAIEKSDIQGWDRFGRFKPFKSDSKGDDCDRFNRVLDALAAQHRWDEAPDANRSPLDEAEDFAGSNHCFEWGWLENQLPDFSAIVAGAAGQPSEPERKPSKREENNDKVLIGVLLQVLKEKKVFESQSDLIKYLIDNGYDDYEGIKKSSLEGKFSEANKSLLPKHLRK